MRAPMGGLTRRSVRSHCLVGDPPARNQRSWSRDLGAHASPAKRAMKDKSRQNGRPKPEEDFSEFGEVRVISRPAPDAEDRLRRLFTLLLGSPAGNGQGESEEDSPLDERHVDDHVEAES